VKVIDVRSVNCKYWIYYGSLTNQEFTLSVTGTLTGAVAQPVSRLPRQPGQCRARLPEHCLLALPGRGLHDMPRPREGLGRRHAPRPLA
jgi:hypothetical protein